jgi:site-specific DNA-cytosine methylase
MRLQGFLEEDFEPHSNDRIAYEQAGNAVNADVVAEIARLLLPILR